MASATDPKIDSLKKLGRNALIELAIKKVDDSSFVASEYDEIVVKASKKELVVEFSLSIAFKSKKSCYYHNVWVTLAGESMGIAKSITGDCDEPAYYKRSKEESEKLKFVFDSINAGDEIGHVPDHKLPAGTRMTISESATHYDVETSSWSTFSYFKVNKITGKISDAGHKHYARDGDEEDEYEIIE